MDGKLSQFSQEDNEMAKVVWHFFVILTYMTEEPCNGSIAQRIQEYFYNKDIFQNAVLQTILVYGTYLSTKFINSDC